MNWNSASMWTMRMKIWRKTAWEKHNSPVHLRCIGERIANEILMALRSSRKTKNEISLDDPIGSDPEGNEVTLGDLLGTDANLVSDEVTLSIESARALRLIGTVLDARERTVILMRCGLTDGVPYPQHEVARRLGISRSYVSRIEKKALEKLRSQLEK